MLFRSLMVSSPSRFIREIDPCFLEFAGGEPARAMNTFVPKQSKPVFHSGQANRASELKPVNTYNQPNFPLNGNPNDDFGKIKTGMTVEHSRFGQGKVVAIDGSGANAKVTVHFGNAGQKQLLLKFAKLKIVE